MKLHFHLSNLYLYVPVMESDGLKLIALFEDLDETFINYNITCNKKKLNYLLDTELESKNSKKIGNYKQKNFFNEFFFKKK